MTEKEKAKSYDDSIERAKKLYGNGITKEIFLELKESKDKKIREAILNGLIDCRDAPDLGWSNFGGIHIDDCIDWLEKQGEQVSSQTNEELIFDKKLKFDPKTLKPFDKVLVRDGLSGYWCIGIFSHYIKGDVCPCKCVGDIYTLCIPYNKDTKYLVGTTDEAPEYYRYWKD